MPNHLWFRLTAAFALVIFVGVLVTVLLTRSGTATQFEHFMLDGHMVRPAIMQQTLADYYYHHQGWSQIQEVLPALVAATADGMMSGVAGAMMGMRDNHLVVIDTEERVIAKLPGAAASALLEPPLQRWPLVVNDQVVGTMVVQGALMGAGDIPNLLIGSVTRTVLLAALVAGLVALALAGLIVRQITLPLDDLSKAARLISAGDLTARVRMESEDEIGALAQSFNQMADGLQRQEVLRRNLMADVAHELRTPLTGIQGAVEAMQDGVFPTDAENLAALHEEIMLLNRLVDDLRILATAEAGQLALQCRRFDMADLCCRQVNLFQYTAQTRNVMLTAVAEPSVPAVYADEQRIGQVLHNLLDNALRHCHAGGSVTVSVDTGSLVGKPSVTVTVVDDGEGISADDLAHVFDRFYRADRSRSRAGGGTGLGLAIARQLVLAHGGDVWVQSPPPGELRGATFRFSLPVAAGQT